MSTDSYTGATGSSPVSPADGPATGKFDRSSLCVASQVRFYSISASGADIKSGGQGAVV